MLSCKDDVAESQSGRREAGRGGRREGAERNHRPACMSQRPTCMSHRPACMSHRPACMKLVSVTNNVCRIKKTRPATLQLTNVREAADLVGFFVQWFRDQPFSKVHVQIVLLRVWSYNDINDIERTKKEDGRKDATAWCKRQHEWCS